MATPLEVSPLHSVGEVSKEWLTSILSHKMNVPIIVKSMEMKVPESKAGFLSEICFLQVSLNVDNTSSEICLVIKVLPHNQEVIAFMNMGKLGEREAAFYRCAGTSEFLEFCRSSGLDSAVPEVYYSGIKNDALTLVLSDMKAKGYQMHLIPEGNDMQQIKSTFEAIAVIHAYGYTAIRKHGREYFHIPFDSSYLDDIVCQGLQLQIKMLSGNSLAETLTTLVGLHKEMIAVSRTNPLIETLVHGDLWAGNLMFDNKNACVLDWQFFCIDNPLCDVTSMFLMSAVPSVYEDHLDEALQSYWNSFSNALIKNHVDVPIRYEDILNNLQKMWMHGFMFFSASLPDMMSNSKITKERVLRVISFVDKIGVLSSFIDENKKIE